MITSSDSMSMSMSGELADFSEEEENCKESLGDAGMADKVSAATTASTASSSAETECLSSVEPPKPTRSTVIEAYVDHLYNTILCADQFDGAHRDIKIHLKMVAITMSNDYASETLKRQVDTAERKRWAQQLMSSDCDLGPHILTMLLANHISQRCSLWSEENNMPVLMGSVEPPQCTGKTLRFDTSDGFWSCREISATDANHQETSSVSSLSSSAAAAAAAAGSGSGSDTIVLDLDFNPSGNKEKEKEKENCSGSGSAASSSSSAEAKRDPGAKAPKEAETSNTIEPWLQHAMGQGWDMDKTVSKGSYKFFNTSTEQVDGRKLIVSVHVFSTRGKFWLRKGWGFKFTKNNQKGVRSAGKSTKRDNSREYFLVQVEKDFTRNGDVVGVLYDVQEDTCFRARVANLTPGVGTVPNPEKMLLRAKNGNVTSQIPPNQSKSGGKKQPSKRKHESKKSNAPKKMKLSDPPPLRADPPPASLPSPPPTHKGKGAKGGSEHVLAVSPDLHDALVQKAQLQGKVEAAEVKYELLTTLSASHVSLAHLERLKPLLTAPSHFPFQSQVVDCDVSRAEFAGQQANGALLDEKWMCRVCGRVVGKHNKA